MLYGVSRVVLVMSVLLLFSGLFGLCIADNSSVGAANIEMAPINPDYLAYKELVTANSVEENQTYQTGFVPPECRISDPTDNMEVLASAIQYPSSYDLRSQGRVTSVKNQNPWGTCWAFAAMSSLESNLMPNENLNFSEKNMVNRNLKGSTPDSGGNFYNSGGYLAAQLGPVSEQNDPYPSDTWNYTSPSGPVEKNVYQINWLPDRNSSTDLSAIKDSVINYGALSTTYYENSGWNSTFNSYYYPTSTSINHAVAIVGWDDNFSRSNFTSPPPGDGAFLIKNSWGTSWADGGYGWISYYDANIGKYNVMFFGSNTSRYDQIYQHDLAGPTTSFTLDYTISSWGASCYNVTNTGYLNAIGFYTTDSPTSYEVKVYTNLTTTPSSGVEKYSCNGTYDCAGYHVINLTTPVKLMKEDRFSIVTHQVNTDYNYSLPIQYLPNTRGYNPAISDGDGYYSSNGATWVDSKLLNDDNSTTCIKGYVSYSAPSPVITDFTPKTGNNSSTSFSMNVTGSNIQEGAALKLVNTVSGQSIFNYTPTIVDSEGSNLGTTFNLSGSVAGTYLVNLTNPDGGSVVATSQFILTSGQGDIFTIVASAGTGGSISPSGTVQVAKGSNQAFSISPNAGYSIKDVLTDNSSAGAVSSYTFPNVTANHTIYALFNSTGGLTHNITATAGAGGLISPSGVVAVNHGANQTFNITSNLGMVVNTVLVDNVSQGAIRSYIFPNVTEDHTIAASFKVLYPQRWYIDATAGVGGTIEPSGLVSVFDQYNKSFTIAALQDYSISDVIINDSVNLGAQASPFVYNFTKVGSNQSIHAQFSQVPDSYLINSSSNRWSKIIPSGSNSYPASSNQSFVMQARPGSTLTNVSVDDILHNYPVGNWTFTNLTKDYSIRVNGTPIPGLVQVFFDASPRRGPAPLTVQFSDQSLGTPTSFFWQFGDGTTNATPFPSHTYNDPGTYAVTLRANNDQSGGYGMWNKFITVTNGVEPEPTPTPVPGRITASFDVSLHNGTAPLDVLFTDTSSGNPISWIWDFGDGKTSTLQNATHRYTTAGAYSVTLLAQNSDYSGSVTVPNAVIVN